MSSYEFLKSLGKCRQTGLEVELFETPPDVTFGDNFYIIQRKDGMFLKTYHNKKEDRSFWSVSEDWYLSDASAIHYWNNFRYPCKPIHWRDGF